VCLCNLNYRHQFVFFCVCNLRHCYIPIAMFKKDSLLVTYKYLPTLFFSWVFSLSCYSLLNLALIPLFTFCIHPSWSNPLSSVSSFLHPILSSAILLYLNISSLSFTANNFFIAKLATWDSDMARAEKEYHKIQIAETSCTLKYSLNTKNSRDKMTAFK